jgi:NAD(P)-dependent dehydrogenase (short-subunit alcohol dehydrogenase family)
MSDPRFKTALIVGAGSGLSAALARRFAKAGLRVGFAARNADKLAGLAAETGGTAFRCDATDLAEVKKLFADCIEKIGEPDVVVYNAAGRVRGPFIDLDPDLVERALAIAAFGGFLVAQEAAKRMLPRRRGAILFTGATASVKGFPHSSSFAMGKFALRGLAQSLARELAPQGIHVAHFVIDGAIGPARGMADGPQDNALDPDAIAESYFAVLEQPRSAWTWEVELRPWVEKF